MIYIAPKSEWTESGRVGEWALGAETQKAREPNERLWLEKGKNPHYLSSVLFGFFPATEKWKFGSGSVRFFVQSFGSVLFGSMRVLIHIYLVYMFTVYLEIRIAYRVWVKKKSTGGFLTFFPKRLGIFSQILLAYYFSYLR